MSAARPTQPEDLACGCAVVGMLWVVLAWSLAVFLCGYQYGRRPDVPRASGARP